MSELTLEELMNLSDQKFYEEFESWVLQQKKQVEKGLEIEMWRLANTISELTHELEVCEESERGENLKSLLELTKLFTRMQSRLAYSTYMLRKEAQELMKRGLK